MESGASGLIPTLIMSLVAAFAGGLAARSLNLPAMLGYLLAGIAVGPFTPGYSADPSIASDLADIGVALILFTVGLHFSFKDLIAVRRIAVGGALIQMALSSTLGFLVAFFLFESSFAASLVIGLSFSIASTAICSRVLEERQQCASLAGRVAVGWLVVQDIVTILALVALPYFVPNEKSDETLMASVGRTLYQIGGFALVVLVGARRYVPRLLGFVARIGSRELFTLAVIVTALALAYGSAELFGVSIALGSFFAGVIIGESDFNHFAAAEALSLQQIFTILFFVSAGMLFDPQSFLDFPLQIMISWGIIVLGMGGAAFLILAVMHVPLRSAALVGGAFAQAGEFSFILAQMGHKWGLLTSPERDLIVAAALASIASNPLIAKGFVKLAARMAETDFVLKWQKSGQVNVPPNAEPLADHVILVGHGRVGYRIAAALKKNNIPYVIIDLDRRTTERLRRAGERVIFGDASREGVLKVAGPERAKLLILTTPNTFQMRQIAALAQRFNPDIRIIARAQEETEARQVQKMGISLAVIGEREVALGLSAYALQNYGVASEAVLDTMNELRQ